MAADGQIEIDITATTEQFKQALKGLTDQVKRESQGMSQTLSSIGNGLSGFGSVMTAGVTLPLAAAAAAAGKFSFDTIAAAEQASIAFETMLGPEKAKSMLEDLADFAASTPFELQGLETSTQKLIAMGFEAEECIPLLTSIGDAASGLGAGQAGIDQITRALGQMNAKGKVQAEEMMQLTEIGIPAWQYLADVISNGDIPAAMAEVTKGTVSADTAIAALQDGMNKDFGGMMSKQAETLTGVLSNMADAVQKPLMAVKDTSGYKQLTESLSGLSDAIGPFVESLMPHFEKALKSGSGVVDTFTDALDAFTNMSEKGQADILGLIPVLAGIGPTAKVAGAGFSVAGSAVGFLTKEITDADGKTTTWGKTIKGTASNLGALKIAGAGLAGVLTAILAGFAVDQIVSYVNEIQNLESATTGLTTAQESARDAVYGTSDAASSGINSWASYGDAIEESISKSAQMAKSFEDTWTEYYTNEKLLNQYVGTIQELAGQTGLTASQQGDLQRAVEQYNKITGDSVEVTDAAAGALSKSADDIRDNADAWLENAKAQAYADSIAEATKTLVEQEQTYQKSSQALEELRRQYEATGSSNDYLAQQIAKGEEDLRSQQETMNATKGTIESYANAMDGVDQSIQAYIGTSESWLNAMGESGIAIESMNSYLESLGLTQTDLASLTPGEINTIVSAYATLSQSGKNADDFASKLSQLGFSMDDLKTIGSDSMNTLASNFDGSLGSLVTACQNAGIEIPGSIGDGIYAGSGGVYFAAGSLAEQVYSALTGQDYSETGVLVSKGMAEGIESDLSAQLAAAGLGDETIQAILDAIDAHSPSRRAEEAGQYVDMGMAAGMDNGTASESSAQSLGNRVLDALLGKVSSFLGVGTQSGTNYSNGLSATQSTAKTAGSVLFGGAYGALANVGQFNTRGASAGQNYASGVGSKRGSASSAGSSLLSSAYGALSGVSQFSSRGNSAGQGYASGIGGARGSVSSRASSLKTAAAGQLQTSNASTWGSHLGQNFASGIRGAISLVRSAASSLADAAASILKHSVPKEGPLREGGKGEAVWGLHLAKNFANGIASGTDLVTAACTSLASSISDRMQNAEMPMIEIDGQLTSLAIPKNMSAQLAGISAESIIQAPVVNGEISVELSDGLATIANKLDEVTKRIDQMDKNVSAKLASPVQLKYNRREVGRMQREVV